MSKRSRDDFMFLKKEDSRLVKLPGSLNGMDFVLDTVKNCSVYILDRTAQITGDEVTDSKLYIGPVEGAIFLRDCHNCTISVICRQFRLKKCTNLTIFLYSASDPSIELSSNLRFAPFNFKYPYLDAQIQAARIDVSRNFWSQVFDFNAKPDEAHWTILPPKEFYEEEFDEVIEGAEATNPVPRHFAYGGTLSEEILLGSQQQPGAHGGMMSFSINTSQEQAEKVIASSSPFEDPSSDFLGKPDDEFFGAAPSSDDYSLFFKPAEDINVSHDSQSLFASNPVQSAFIPQSSSDPFVPQSLSDPFAQPASGDPFAQQSSDPFAPQASGDPFAPQTSDDPFAEPKPSEQLFDNSEPVVEHTPQEDAEELELRRLRDAEYQERMNILYQKEEKERSQKEERRLAAKEQLNKWHSDRAKQTALRKELNREQQRANSKQRSDETPWKKVASMVDFKEAGSHKDLGRFRGVLLAQKNK